MTGEELNILSKIKVRSVEEQRDYLLEQNMLLAGKIATLEKENAKLKEFVNAPHTKGRKTTRGDYIKTVWDLSKQLTKAKELLKQWLQTSKASGCDNINIVTDSEQFLEEIKEK